LNAHIRTELWKVTWKAWLTFLEAKRAGNHISFDNSILLFMSISGKYNY
jgi:hypothetical protein